MKRLYFFGLLASLFLLAACGEQQQAGSTGGAFIGGGFGIVASFEPLSIQEGGIYTIFDTEDFPIDVVLRNKGEETVNPNDVSLRLLGPAPTDFTGITPAVGQQTSNRQTIEKISEFNPAGAEEVISFTPTARARYTAQVTGLVDLVWNLEYWYKYKTHVIVNDVCFKGDLTDTKICTVEEAKSFAVSGAPITVTAVEEDSAGRGVISLKITVKNTGTGKSTIPGQDFDTRFDQIRYSIEEPAKWVCTSGGRDNEARLIDGTAEIRCKLNTPLADEDLYTKTIRMDLEYVYKDLVQEKLRVKESVR